MSTCARSWRKRLFVGLGALALGAALTFTPGCYHYRVTAFDADDPVHKFSETRHAFLWGIFAEPVLLTPTSDDPSRYCESNSLYEVRVSTNFGTALATVLTLGIWAPARVEWTCAAPEPNGGDFDDFGPPPGDQEGDPPAGDGEGE